MQLVTGFKNEPVLDRRPAKVEAVPSIATHLPGHLAEDDASNNDVYNFVIEENLLSVKQTSGC